MRWCFLQLSEGVWCKDNYSCNLLFFNSFFFWWGGVLRVSYSHSLSQVFNFIVDSCKLSYQAFAHTQQNTGQSGGGVTGPSSCYIVCQPERRLTLAAIKGRRGSRWVLTFLWWEHEDVFYAPPHVKRRPLDAKKKCSACFFSGSRSTVFAAFCLFCSVFVFGSKHSSAFSRRHTPLGSFAIGVGAKLVVILLHSRASILLLWLSSRMSLCPQPHLPHLSPQSAASCSHLVHCLFLLLKYK